MEKILLIWTRKHISKFSQHFEKDCKHTQQRGGTGETLNPAATSDEISSVMWHRRHQEVLNGTGAIRLFLNVMVVQNKDCERSNHKTNHAEVAPLGSKKNVDVVIEKHSFNHVFPLLRVNDPHRTQINNVFPLDP